MWIKDCSDPRELHRRGHFLDHLAFAIDYAGRRELIGGLIVLGVMFAVFFSLGVLWGLLHG